VGRVRFRAIRNIHRAGPGRRSSLIPTLDSESDLRLPFPVEFPDSRKHALRPGFQVRRGFRLEEDLLCDWEGLIPAYSLGLGTQAGRRGPGVNGDEIDQGIGEDESIDEQQPTGDEDQDILPAARLDLAIRELGSLAFQPVVSHSQEAAHQTGKRQGYE
jgi:hypothetical protein